MYSMILLDDERIVLQGIQKVFKMEEYGFEIAGTFTNPIKALEELPRLKPHLIITDVKMPQMDGLEFATRAKELMPDAEIVILSGYDDFSYAQSAVKIGVGDYLLKPVKKANFAEMLHRMHDRIQEKSGQAAYYGALQEYAENNQTEIKNRFFLSMAENGCQDEAYIRAFCGRMQLDLEKEDFVLIKFVINELQMEEDYMSAVGKMMEEFKSLLEPFGKTEVFLSDEEIYFMVYGKACRTSAEEIAGTAESFVESKRNQKLYMAAGVSDPANGIGQLFVARNECDDRILMGGSKHQQLGDSAFGRGDLEITIPYNDIEALFAAISLNSAEQMRESIERIYDLPAHALYRDYSCSLTFIILLRLSNLLNRYGQEHQMLSRDVLDIRKLKREYPGIIQQKELVANTAVVLADLISRKEVASPTKIVRDALSYIRDHYNENISLTDVSRHINISKNYLCDIFKKELNVTFINYVTNLRIEKAKELLITSDMKMYEISLQVGYNDYAYFSQIFKRYTGTTLSAYRRQH